MDIEDVNLKYNTYLNGIEHLACAVENGEYLGPEARTLIAGLLRREITFPRGPKRTAVQADLEGEIVFEIENIMHLWDVSEYRAKAMFLEQNPDVKEETLKAYLKKAKDYEKSKRGPNFIPKRMATNFVTALMIASGPYEKGCLSGERYNASCREVLKRKTEK